MKTIKDKAETNAVNLWLNPETYNEDKADGYMQGYIDGATEQKKIDIEKACKWLAEHADDYSRSSLTDISRYLWVDPHLIADFRKAMED